MKKLLYQLFSFTYSFKRWLTSRFTSSGLAILFCLVIAALVGIDTKQSVAYQIFTFLLSITAMSIAYSLYFPKTFSATARTLPRFTSVGYKLRYTITLGNPADRPQKGLILLEDIDAGIPSWTVFKRSIDTSNSDPISTKRASNFYRKLVSVFGKQRAITKSTALPDLQPHSQTKVSLEIVPQRRGVLRLTGVRVARRDPFGLFNAFKTITLPQSLLVLPKRYQLPALHLPGTRRYQSGGISLASSVGDSAEFMSLRDYRPGDSLRKIHWKSWAKIDKPVVREEQDEYFVRHALVLDTFHSGDRSEELEESISIAASFACNLQTQESLLDLMFVGIETYCFTSGRGLHSSEKLLEVLAGVTACQNKSFESLTNSVMSRASLLSGCICIFLDWDERRKQLVSYLKELGIPSLAIVVTQRDYLVEDDEKLFHNIHFLKLGSIQEGLLNL